MSGIIPGKDKKVVFERVVTQAMENLVSEGEVSITSFLLKTDILQKQKYFICITNSFTNTNALL